MDIGINTSSKGAEYSLNLVIGFPKIHLMHHQFTPALEKLKVATVAMSLW